MQTNINKASTMQGDNEAGAHSSIVKKFEEIVHQFQTRLAIKDGEQSWDYGQFNELVNQIADGILNLRGNQSEPVAIFVSQGAMSVASMLAVLKAGKYYVPLDPAFPPIRNRFILDNSRVLLLITDSGNIKAARELAPEELPIVQVEEIALNASTKNPEVVVSPDSPAYILYTSGSTGQPKGVIQNHRGVLHNAARQMDVLKLSPGCRATMLYSPSVMGAARDIYNVLLSGAALFPFDVRTKGLGELAAWLIAEEINVLHTISSVYRHLVDTFPDKRYYAKLKKLILGGEAVLQLDFDSFRQYFPDDAVLITGLGSTETGTICLIALNKYADIKTSTVPLGFPTTGVNILVLDENDQPVAQGAIGEICALSSYLAQGYWNNPELTEKTFTEGGEGKKLFHTGDLGQFLPNGSLLHCGRKDFQVKLRGFRIETAEIEVAIRNSGMVADVVVTLFSTAKKQKRLVAYLVPRINQTLSIKTLKEFLAARLPDHMIPAHFEILSTLPLTPNGKVDRNALPEPTLWSENSLSTPRNQAESILLEIWQDILATKEIDMDDNFFDIGGDSLLASSMLVNIEQLFGKRLPLSILIENDTIAKLAKFIVMPKIGSNKALVAIHPTGSLPPLFAFPGGHGDVLYLRQLAAYLSDNQPFYGLQTIHTNITRLPTVEDIAKRYLPEIKEIQPEGPYLLAGHSFGGYVALEMARQLKARGDSVALLALWDTHPPGPRRQAAFIDRIRLHFENMSGLPIRGQFEYIFQRFEAVTIKSSRYSFMRKLLNSVGYRPSKNLAASQVAKYSYNPPPYDGDMVFFKASERPWYIRWDPMENWQRYVTGQIRVYTVSGGHGTLLFEPHVRELAEYFNECLSQIGNTLN